MPPVGFEPTISAAGERPQIYALDRAVTAHTHINTHTHTHTHIYIYIYIYIYRVIQKIDSISYVYIS